MYINIHGSSCKECCGKKIDPISKVADQETEFQGWFASLHPYALAACSLHQQQEWVHL